ncbi:MAG: hypothetical protein ABSG62_11625 [Terracidiphilus sp.]
MLPILHYNLLHGWTCLYRKEKPLYAFGYGLSYRSFACEGNQSGERLPGFKQSLHHRIAEFRREHIAVEADDQLRLNLKAQSLRNRYRSVRRAAFGLHRLSLYD